MRSFQFPIKAANRDFLARVSNRTKLFFVSSTMDQRAEQEEQYFRGEDYKAQYLCGNLLSTFQKNLLPPTIQKCCPISRRGIYLEGRRGEQSVKLDHLSRFASRCLTAPASGGKSYHWGHCTVELYFVTPCDVFILKYSVF